MVKAADGTEINNEVITLARQYRKELMAGQKSQAKLVFLQTLHQDYYQELQQKVV